MPIKGIAILAARGQTRRVGSGYLAVAVGRVEGCAHRDEHHLLGAAKECIDVEDVVLATRWSQRARNRPVNRGLRLDYFWLSASVPRAAVLEVQHLQRLPMHGSDHAPVLLEIDLAQL